MRRLRIAVYDDIKDELDASAEALARIFEAAGITTEIHKFQLSEWTAENGREFRQLRPEIAIFDNHVGDDPLQEMFGQQVISVLKPLYPDCVFGLLTKVDIKAHSLPVMVPHPDVILQKLRLETGPQKYWNWVVNSLTGSAEKARIGEIDATAVSKQLLNLKAKDYRGKNRPISPEELESLVSQVCYTGGSIGENIIEEVKLEPLLGGKSEAAVTVLSVRNKFGAFQVPAVLKLMRREAAYQEAHNHAKYVKWVLPYRWRVDVIGKGFTADFGAVCYSFAHGGAGKPETLDKLIGEGQFDRVRKVMEQVFDPGKQAWYSQSSPNGSEKIALNVFLGGCAPYFVPSADEIARERQVRDYVKRIEAYDNVELLGEESSGRVRIGEHDFATGSLVSQFLAIREIADTVMCLSHGDLNAANILVPEGSNEFSFIDFQHTGYHHRARDFCSLEGSIRTRLPPEGAEEFVELIELEVEAWKRVEDRSIIDTAATSLVDALRCCYFKNHKSSSLEFAMASFVHTLWMISFTYRDPKSWTELQERRLLAFLFGTWIAIHEKQVSNREFKIRPD